MEQVGHSGSFCWASDFCQPLAKVQIFRTLGPVSRTSRKLLGLEKPFVKLGPAYSVKLVFSYVVKGWKIKTTVSCLCTIFLAHIYVLSVTVLTLWVAPPEMFCRCNTDIVFSNYYNLQFVRFEYVYTYLLILLMRTQCRMLKVRQVRPKSHLKAANEPNIKAAY